MRNRFDLEEAIMNAWNTANDIKLITEMLLDGNVPMSEDEISNLLIGIESLHNLRSQKVFDIFEELVNIGSIKDIE